MAHLMDKSALVAEIERKIEEPAPSHDSQCSWEDGYYCGLCKAESIIDTLEVKEVDLEKEISNYLYSHLGRPRMELELDWTQYDIKCKADKLIAFAKYFFELGIKVQN